jgi:hypothetical protein
MEVVGLNEEWPNGLVFHSKEVIEDGSITGIPVYDWADIEQQMTPLVERVLEKASASMRDGAAQGE